MRVCILGEVKPLRKLPFCFFPPYLAQLLQHVHSLMKAYIIFPSRRNLEPRQVTIKLLQSLKTTATLIHYTCTTLFFIRTSTFELSLDRSYFLGSFSLDKSLRMFLNFSNGNLITLRYIWARQDNAYSFHINELYKYNVNVSLTINRNVLKEQNFTCTLIPCRTLCKTDFMDLGKYNYFTSSEK